MLSKIKSLYFNFKFRSLRTNLSKEVDYVLEQLLDNKKLSPSESLKILENRFWSPGVLVLDAAYYSMLPSVWSGASALVSGTTDYNQFFTLAEARQRGLSEYVLDYLLEIGFIRSIVNSNRFQIPLEIFFYLKLKGGEKIVNGH